MMRRKLVLVAVSLGLAACSGSEGGRYYGVGAESDSRFPPLPTHNAETVVLKGKMAFWLYEGQAGCYGYLTDGMTEVQLWVDMETCGDVQYERNAEASVAVTYNAEHQYGLGKTYTIKSFL